MKKTIIAAAALAVLFSATAVMASPKAAASVEHFCAHLLNCADCPFS